MPRSRDFDDDWDDPPRPKQKRKTKSRPSTGLLIALGAGLGLLILMLVGGVGFLIYGGFSGSLPLGGLLPHPALAKPATPEMFNRVETLEPLSSVERKLGAGYALSAAETESITVPLPNQFGGRERTRVKLRDYAIRPPGSTVTMTWYQWGSGASRLFVLLGVEAGGGEPVVWVKYFVAEHPNEGYTIMTENAQMTFRAGLPAGGPPRK